MDSAPTDQSLNATDYLRPLWAHKYLIAMLVVIATVSTYVYYDRQPERFSSSTDIYLRNSPAADAALTGTVAPVTSQRELANQARLLRTRSVARRVAKKIGFNGEPDALLDGIEVTPSADADLVTLTAVAGSAGVAADVANAFAAAFVEQRDAARKQTARTSRIAAQRQLDDLPKDQRESPTAAQLQFRVGQLAALENLSSSTAVQLEAAEVPAAPFEPNPLRNAIFAFALSLMLGTIGAYGLDRLDRRIRGVHGVRDAYDAPILATLPRVRQLTGGAKSTSSPPPPEMVETFRTLRSAVDLTSAGDTPQVLMVTSAQSEEGKSTVARNLAIACREAGRSVALVDADLRRPSIAATFGLRDSPGLSDVLAGRSGMDEALQHVTVGIPDIEEMTTTWGNGHEPPIGAGAGALTVLTSGSRVANPATLLSVPRFAELIAQLRLTYDNVVIDSAPLLAVSDSLHLLPRVDGVLLVSRVGRTTHAGAARLTELLDRYPHAPILGVVANDVPDASGEYGYGDYDYIRA